MSRKREYKKGEKVGNFRLCKYLGGGGNGEVWKVQHEFEGKSFSALKILHSRFHTDKKRYDRFCIEAKTQKRMAEEGEKGVLPVLGFHLPDTPCKSDPPWIRTPVASAVTTSNSAKNGDYNVRDDGLSAIVKLVSRIAETLIRLEVKTIFHRDLKPSNIFLHESQWVLGDFGLVTTDDSEITQQGDVVGPRGFIAPEMRTKAHNADAGPADVYSLAKVLWYLSSDLPTTGNVPECCLNTDLPELTISFYNSGIKNTKGLDTLVQQATHENPLSRPKMDVFAKVLTAWMSSEGDGKHRLKNSDLTTLKNRLNLLTPTIDIQIQRLQSQNNAHKNKVEMVSYLKTSVGKIVNEIEIYINEQKLPNVFCQRESNTGFDSSRVDRWGPIIKDILTSEEQYLKKPTIIGLKLSVGTAQAGKSLHFFIVFGEFKNKSFLVKYGYFKPSSSIAQSPSPVFSNKSEYIEYNQLLIDEAMKDVYKHACEHLNVAVSYLVQSLETYFQDTTD